MVLRDIDKIDIPDYVWKKRKEITKDYPITALDTETENGNCIFIADQTGRFHIPNHIDDLLNFLMYKPYQNSINFFYNVKYDTNAIIKLLPNENLKHLALYNETIYEDRRYRQYHISIIPDKLLKIRYEHHTSKFFDLAQFYNKKKLESLAKRVDMEKYMLDDISNLSKEKLLIDNEYFKEVFKRCVIDCEITYRLAKRLNDAVNKFVKIRDYYSGASISRQLVLQKLNEQYLKLPSLKMMDYALKSYNAGRFEIIQKGYFPSMVERDINSAYPYEIANLYDCEGTYVYNTEYEPESTHSFFICDLEIYDTVFSPFKFQLPNNQSDLRKITSNYKYLHPNLMIYPVGKFKEQYLTKRDYESIYNAGFPIKIKSAVHLFNKNPTKPFEYVEDLYYYRKDVQKGNPDKGIIQDEDLADTIKRGLNSIYGTMININREKGLSQKESEKTDNYVIINNEIWFIKGKTTAGNMFNPVFASEITSGCRNTIYDDFNKYEDKIICIATDGIKLTSDVNIKESNKLGGYDKSKTTTGYLIGSGIYQFGDKTAFRGFEVDKNERKDFLTLEDQLKKFRHTDIITSVVNRVINLKYAYRNKEVELINDDGDKYIQSMSFDEINSFVKINRNLNINFDKKRIWDRDFINCQDVLENNIQSQPIEIIQK